MPPISEGINGWLSSTEFFKSLLLSFSPNLDEFNPDIPEWRQDVGRVIKKALLQVSDFHFLCPFLSLLPILSNCSISLYISSFRCYFSIISYTPITSAPHPHTHPHPGLICAVRGSSEAKPPIIHQINVEMYLLSFSPLWSVLSVNNNTTTELRSCL